MTLSSAASPNVSGAAGMPETPDDGGFFVAGPASLQQFSPAAARFCLGVERFCLKDLRVPLGGTSLLVAFSGGADSLALFYALRALSRRLDLRLGLAILDHGLRDESAGEVRMAGQLAAMARTPFYSRRVAVAERARQDGMGVEEAGRVARYSFLQELRAQHGYDWVVTGHHLNDLAEDSLMRILRGSGWPALAGMSGVIPDRFLLRPLLLTPRSAIETFLTSLGARWITDASNNDPRYRRNRIRHTLLPECMKENPAFLEHVAFRWRMARLDEAWFTTALAGHIPSLTEQGVFLERSVIAPLEPALRLRLFKAVLDSLSGGQVRAEGLFGLHAAWEQGEGGKELRFPGRKRARITHGGIRFWHAADSAR